MPKAKAGDTVKVDYIGKLNDGTVFDSSEGQEPLQFTLGSGQIIPGFEQAVVGMSPGDSKTIEVTAEKGFGPYLEELIHVIDRAQVPSDLNLEVGRQLQINSQESDEQPIKVTVTEVTDEKVTLDANHPLAGEDLTFEINLVEIV